MRAGLPVAALVALAPAAAAAGDFVDTTITFVASDDNVLAGAGETIPSSPRFDFRPRRGNNLFFDNYNRRDTGEETRTHLVLYKAFEGHFDRLTPEAAMVLEWDANRTARNIERYEETGSRRTFAGIRDDGSYLAIHYDLTAEPDVEARDRISVVLFPFDSDRFRLGYSWELTWGGNQSFLLGRQVPGVKVGWRSPGGYVYAGAKSARTQRFTAEPDDPHRDENEAVYGFLGGAGLWVADHLLVEVGGGWFDKGTIPIDRGTLQGTPINQYGATAQITWAVGVEPPTPVDTKLYRNAGPAPVGRRWKRAPFGYLVAAEASVTSQILEDADRIGTTRRDYGYAGDVNVMVRDGAWSLNLDLVARSLEFLVQDTPGLFPFSTVPDTLDTRPELFAALGADYYIESLHLQPGLTLGVQLPAVARNEGVGADGGPVETVTVVRKTKNVLGQTTVEPVPLPSGEEVRPVFSAKLNLAGHLSPIVTVIAELQLTVDHNLTTNDPEAGVRSFENPYILGLGLLAQARF